MHRWLTILTCLLIASPASAISRRHDVADSNYTVGNAYPEIVHILGTDGQVGTGTLIAPDWVLTAAAVVTSGNLNSVKLKTGGYVPPDGGYMISDGVTSAVAYPGYSGDVTAANNLKLIQLKGPAIGEDGLPLGPLTRYSGSVASLVGDPVEIYGYGYTANGIDGVTDPHSRTKRRTTNVIDGQGSILNPIFPGSAYSDNLVVTDFDGVGVTNRFGSATPTTIEGSPAPGDGGGPWIAGGQVVAITSFYGTNNYKYRDIAGAEALSPFNDWINETMGGVNWNVRGTYSFQNSVAWGDGRVPNGKDVRFSLPYDGAAIPPTTLFAGDATVQKVQVEFGTHRFDIGGMTTMTATGTITVDQNGTMILSSGTIHASATDGLRVGLTPFSQGTFQQVSGTMSVTNNMFLGANADSRGTYQLDAGTLTLQNLPMAVGHRGEGEFIQNGGAVNAPEILIGRVAGAVGEYYLHGGQISVEQNVFVGYSGSGTFEQSGGTTSAVEVSVGRLGGSIGNLLLSGGTLQTSASLVAGYGGQGEIQVTGAAATINVGSSLFVGIDGTGDGTFIQDAGTVNVTNALMIGQSTGSIGRYKLKNGTLNTQSGNITLGTGNAAFEFTGGTLHVGTYNGNLLNSGGKLSPGNSAGHTQINGTYNQVAASAALEIEVGGTTTSTGYDKVDVTGTAMLGGNLLVSLLSGFTPSASDMFTVFDAASITGQFLNAAPGAVMNTVDGLHSFRVFYGAGSLFDPTQIVLTSFAPPLLPGDYNSDNRVDAADYIVWRKKAGTNALLPNDAIGGQIGTGQFNQWKSHFGGGSGFGVPGDIPEPSGLLLTAVGTCISVGFARRRRAAVLGFAFILSVQQADASPPGCTGDYNGDRQCTTAEDYVVWRKALFTNSQLLNDATPGTTDSSDYQVWRSHFGLEVSPGQGAANDLALGGGVPEPSGLLLATIGGLVTLAFVRRQCANVQSH